MNSDTNQMTGDEVALIGMAGRWPGANTPGELWRNICGGIDSISHFSTDDLEVVNAAKWSGRADFVKSRSVVSGAESFDADFFGILPKEAELIDPQHRVFLECCWEALEDAGYDPAKYPGAIGVMAGCAMNTYFLRQVCAGRNAVEEFTANYPLGNYAEMLGALSDTLATRVSYKLNLRGPSFSIQSACSTSLVAICQACQSLLSYQSDMVLAGGIAITFPQQRGYFHQEGGMGSADGRCRPFEANATGTVFGNGAGVVLLKRLDDAIADGDHIYAVIKGFALNNDGSTKVGFTAPSIEGQAQVISLAQEFAGIEPESIGYLEAHGTATPLGDPIEFAALSRVFREKTQAKQFCALGTVKRNIGHIEMAAGVTGLINAAQALSHRQLPPTSGFEAPNPGIDLANSPFYINPHTLDWPRGAAPRRAGVSSFGVGGTNAHLVLEESPSRMLVSTPAGPQLLVLSARSPAALEKVTDNLVEHLRKNLEADLRSVAYTLQAGRRTFDNRRTVVCSNTRDAAVTLEARDSRRVLTRTASDQSRSLVFMFPGQGSQHIGMGKALYDSNAGFRADLDECAQILLPHLHLDLRKLLYPETAAPPTELRDTSVSQPALFALEYALARHWMRWGLQPAAMIGHSVGEFVAACLAGVFSLEDALAIVAARGRMMQQLPRGGMLSVRLSSEKIAPLLHGELSLAASNSPQLCVVSGPESAIDGFAQRMEERGVVTRRLMTSHAFHSRMMDPIIAPFTELLAKFRFETPKMPYVSCVSGTWITPAEATDPGYWARHFREPVQFRAGMQTLRSLTEPVFLEVGPSNVLSTLAMQQPEVPKSPMVAVASLPAATAEQDERHCMLEAAGKLWRHGVSLNWENMHGPGPQRCSLPTYPFERRRFWVEPPKLSSSESDPSILPAPPEVTNPDVEIAMTRTNSVPTRMTALRTAVIEIFEDLSGKSLGDYDPTTTFLEMGFDSLFLTQAAQELNRKFGLKIAFRQLLGQESTPEALASYLDGRLPPDMLPAEQPAATAPTVTKPLPEFPQTGSSSAIEAVCREQLQAMSQLIQKQLEMLRGAKPDVALPSHQAPVTPAPAASRPATPASAVQGLYKQVQRESGEGLTTQQSQHIDALIRRYNARTAKSKQLTAAHREVLADPRVAAGFRSRWKDLVYPIVTVRSKGSKLWDVDGNEYIDLLNGFGPIFFGHAPEFVTKAITEQLQAGFEIGPQTPLAGECAELIRELTGNERVTFCNTGSEAVMAAIRLARTVTARDKIVLFSGSYHGTFNEVLVTGFRKAGVPQSRPIAPGIPRDLAGNVIVLDYGTPESLEFIRQHIGELAAVLVEPVQSRHPETRPVEFLREIRRLTEDAGTALIFDEVVTGFRSHPGGAQALFDIRADLVSYGKVAGGGMPIGILAGRSKFMDALDGGKWQYGDDSFPEVGVTFFAGTFVRHPLALSSCLAILKQLKKEGPELQRRLSERMEGLVLKLNAIFKSNNFPVQIEHFTSWFYFGIPSDHPNLSLLYYHLREKGIHIQEGFPCFLTAAHTDADLSAIVKAFEESVTELRLGGFLSTASPSGSTPPNGSNSTPIQKADLPRELALTESQMEVWMSARLGDDASCSFNEAFTLQLRGSLNRQALQKALDRLVLRHDALRSTFDPNRNCVIILDPFPFPLSVVDLSSHSSDERAMSVAAIIQSDASQPFDLQAGPLVRAQLIQLESDLHVLLFTTHHIVCDGWSTNVLLGELAALYESYLQGTDCNLPPAMPFREYALSEAASNRTAQQDSVEQWWVAKFATPVTPLELPLDRPRATVKSFRGDTARKVIGTENYLRLKQFGARNGCTLFATLLAGFKVLLHRLTDQDDIVVGIPAAGQSLVETESLVGHCVNFLPIRTTFPADASAIALLTQVRDSLLDAKDHQSYTFGSLVKRLGLRRDPSRLPLVEVQFNLERIAEGLDFPGLKVEFAPCPKTYVNFDLFLNVIESDAGLALDCDYNRDLFDPETIDRWLGHLETLLLGLASDAKQPVSRLPLLSDTERQQLINERNKTQADYPRNLCLHQLVSLQAQRTPQSTAVVCDERQLTYAQLERDSNRLARFLMQRGAAVDKRVAVCLDRSLDMLVSVLGILKTGAAYLPLDPEFPSERIKSVIQDANPSLVVTTQAVAHRLGLQGEDVICLDRVTDDVIRQDEHDLATPIPSSSTAYVIYTSGSTGKPKGVQISHRAVVNFLHSMACRPGLSPQDTLLAVTTLSFDIAVLELYLPLMVGAKVVIATRDDTIDGDRLVRLMSSSGVTAMQATPATWRLLLEAGWKGSSKLKVLCGGEALPRDLADELLARADSVWNMYGPTETTVWSATSRVEPSPAPVTVGPPIANTEFYVLDRNQQPVPLGVAGELHIGGEGIALGYWNRPKLTAEKFVLDSFRPGPDRRLYKTGDMVRPRPDGTLEFLGRLDNQVKIRGFRIETGDVEHALKQFSKVRECVVVAHNDSTGEKQLVGYYVPDGTPSASGDLRRHLLERLPAYMVPSAFVSLNAIPQTPNGKVDRRALPAPTRTAESVAVGKPPSTPQERTLAEICAAVLKQNAVNVDDNLFDLGADSLRMFQIVARAKDAGLNVTVKQILAGQTVAAVCEELAVATAPAANGPALTSVNRDNYRVQRSKIGGSNTPGGGAWS